MLPSRFEYHRPESIADALALLDRFGEDGKVLAGGQSLIPLMKLRLATPAHVVDVNRVPGLDQIEERDGSLRPRPGSGASTGSSPSTTAAFGSTR